ncbi:MAG TPA: TetR/AcrR family transcriptional regulator [Pilimelia sp.]|nr:TetR/AcrR family transcriptional regulator [Pilimelia sp.]
MTTDAVPGRVDGRTARAERTRRAVVDALLELTAEGVYKPTAERIVERAGVSLRALWTHFKDMETLYAAAGDRLLELQQEIYRPISPSLPLPKRIEQFCRQRGQLLEIVAPAARASALRLPFSTHLQEYRATQNARARDELVELFGAELAAAGPGGREQLLHATVVASTWPAWGVLRDDFGLDVPQATAVMIRSITALLAAALSAAPA